MDSGSIRSLEFSRLLEALAERAATERGRRIALSLLPSNDPDAVTRRLREAEELKELFDRKETGVAPWPDDLEEPLAILGSEAGRLGPEELVRLKGFLGFAQRAREFGNKLPGEFYALKDAYLRFFPAPGLKDAISAAISDEGQVKETASPELRRIRRAKTRTRERLNRLLGDFLAGEATGLPSHQRHVTLREGRLVIPVKAEARSRVGGLVHDYSRSRATVFVEPLDAVPLNNELSLLKAEEREEIERILEELTGLARESRDAIAAGLEALVDLDLIWARHHLAAALGGTVPRLTAAGEGLLLKGALNPLLGLQGSAVPIDLDIPPGVRTIIISGPNTGGKTASLKTLGLISAMAQIGVPVPAKPGASLPLFDHIFAEVGDEQELASRLSTFSAHLGRLKRFLDDATPDSLVLIDELGTGTDPEEGAALGMAVLDSLAKIGALGVVTTHYHALKGYGALKPNVLNCAVGFDKETGRPTYQIIYGQPGMSLGLATAKRLGLARDVLETAEAYLGTGESRTAALLEELIEERERLAQKRAEVSAHREELLGRIDEARKERETIKAERREFLTSQRERLMKLSGEVENRLKHALRELKKREPGAPGAARGAISLAKETLAESFAAKTYEPFTGEVAEGDSVGIQGSSARGEVVTVSEDGTEVEVLVGNMRLKVAKEKLIPLVAAPAEERSDFPLSGVSAPRVEEVSGRLYLLGERVEEALGKLDRFLDRALLAGLSTVEVVHGHGTGRLRDAVGEFLKEHHMVKRYFHPGQKEGGRGVTKVEFR